MVDFGRFWGIGLEKHRGNTFGERENANKSCECGIEVDGVKKKAACAAIREDKSVIRIECR